MTRRETQRGRPARERVDEGTIIRVVFHMRYGMHRIRGRLPADFDRRPGTVDGWSPSGQRVPEPEMTVLEACRRIEGDLKEPLRWFSTHPDTGETEECSAAKAIIGKRRSDGLGREGRATKRALYLALSRERRQLGRVTTERQREDWNRKLAERRQKKSRRRI